MGPDDGCTDLRNLYNVSSPVLYLCSGLLNCIGEDDTQPNGTCSDPLPVGSRCRFDTDCAVRTLMRNGEAFCDAGICKPRLKEGDACKKDSECMGSLACLKGTCVNIRIGKLGSDCSSKSDYTCEDTLQCVDGECVHYAQLGEECDFMDNYFCDWGLACVDRICAPLQTGDIGQTCVSSMSCLPGLICDQDNKCNTVSPNLPQEGCDACDKQSQCICDHDIGAMVCVPYEPITPHYMANYWNLADCMAENEYDEYSCEDEWTHYEFEDPDLPLPLEDYCVDLEDL